MDPDEIRELTDRLNHFMTCQDAVSELASMEARGEDISFAYPLLVVSSGPCLLLLRERMRAGDDLSSVRDAIDELAEGPAVHRNNRVLAREIRDRLDELAGRLPELRPLPEDALSLGEGQSLVRVTHRRRIAEPDVAPQPRPDATMRCGVCGAQGRLSLLFEEDTGVKHCGGSDIDDVTEEYRCDGCGKHTTFNYFDKY